MGTIAHATTFSSNGSSGTYVVTIPSTAAGNILVVASNFQSSAPTSISGASFAAKYSSGVNSIFSAYNVAGSITSITLNFTGYQACTGVVLEISGVLSASDPWDTYNFLDDTYGVTNLGAGTITTGATGAGIAVSVFIDSLSNATACTNGAGWTNGGFSNYVYYESLASSANTGYGGTNGQATATATGPHFYGFIFNLFNSGGGTSLTVNNALSPSDMDNVVLVQHQVLTVQNSLSAPTLQNVALIQHQVLGIANALSPSDMDNVTVTAHGPSVALTVANMLSPSTVGNVALTQHQVLGISNLLSPSDADNVTVTAHSPSGAVLVIQNLLSGSDIDNLNLTLHQALLVDNMLSNSKFPNINFNPAPTMPDIIFADGNICKHISGQFYETL